MHKSILFFIISASSPVPRAVSIQVTKVDKSGYKRKSNPFNVSSGAVNRRTFCTGAGAGTAMLFVARSDKLCNARWEARNDGRNRKIQKVTLINS